ncbi:MFS transporter [Lacipirellula sp.]|uniref:MFS transporter n=1 Tax=Lacipirellula sp. TaxID=2691419 RepID=UPI003D132870
MLATAPVDAPNETAPPSAASGGNVRWKICALLFFAAMINYVDRAVFGILKPTLMNELKWDEEIFANVTASFTFAYALGYGFAGRAMDLLGVRVGYALCVAAWSAAAMGNGLVRTALGFSFMRGALGLAEGGNFPAAIKSVSQWFPKRERALATGIFNSGSSVGALVAPMMVPWITENYGWPAAFYATGFLGFIWLIFWWKWYESPERHLSVSASELAYIQSDPIDPPQAISWLELLRHRQVWAFIVGMSLSSPIWWFYLYWAAGFLYERFGFDLKNIGPPLVVIYVSADVGSIAGGWLSGWLLKRGWSLNAARKITLLVCALCVVPVFGAALVTNGWIAVALIALAAAAHQGFSANLYTLVSDMAPRKVVSSIVGLGGMSAGFVGMGFQIGTGYVLEHWKSGYLAILGVASVSYLVNVLIIHLLVPRLEPMRINSDA